MHRNPLSLLALPAILALPAAAEAQATCTATDAAVTAVNPGDTAALAGDCAALLGIMDTLRGTGTLNWTNTLSMASWDGVTLASDGNRVTELQISSRPLTGSIPDLSALTNLENLGLQNNRLTGSIPDLSALTNFTDLWLYSNKLTGSIVAEHFPASVQRLDLNDNGLTGSIPDLSALTNLKALRLNSNELTGSLPDLSALTSLASLRLLRNELTGTIPTTLGDLPLGDLHLAWNRFSGGIPGQLDSLTSLGHLSLCGNDLDVSATLPAALETRRSDDSLTVWSCLQIADAEGPEGTTLGFDVTHSTWPVRGGDSLTLDYETEDGTATSADYTGATGSVTVPAVSATETEATAEIQVATIADSLVEGDETFTVPLSSPQGQAVLLLHGSAEGTIRDVPPPPPPPPSPPTVSVSAASALESAGAVVFDVRLSRTSGSVVTADYATAEGAGAAGAKAGSDYTATQGILRFPSGTSAQQISVPVTDDGDDEAEVETFTLTLRGPVNATLAGGVSVLQAVGTIQDNDDPEVQVLFGSSVYSAPEGGSVQVTVMLSADAERSVSIPLVRTHGGGVTAADYSGVPASVTFGSGVTTRTFTFTAVDDGEDDDGESVVIGFGALPPRVNGGAGTTVSIEDDDDPEVMVSFGSLRYEAPEGGTVEVTVVLSGDPEREVSIPLVRTHRGGASDADYSGVPASITFSSGVTTRTLEVTATDDGENDDGESVSIGFGDLPSRVNGGAGTTVSIQDNDDPEVMVSFGFSSYEAPEGATVEVTVVLSGDPEREVSIPLVRTHRGGASDADYSGVPASITFSSGVTTRTLEVTATDDGEDDDGESVAIGFGDLPSRVNGGAETTVSIQDNDDPEVVVSFGSSSYEVPEGGTVEVTVVLSADPEREVSIPLVRTHLGGASEADYSGVPASITFSSSVTTRAFEFEAADDSEEDFGESVVLGFGRLPAGVSGGGSATVSIEDDDTPPMAVIAVSGAACDPELCRALTGEPVEFTDTSTGPAASRRWEFGEGTESDLRRLSHSWSEPGFYEVTLWVSDGARESTSSRVFLVEASDPAGTCASSSERRCLQDSRYAVAVEWRKPDGESGAGSVVHAGTNDSGLFTFFSRENWEILIKVLDGCAVNGQVWVYGASTTDLGYVIQVTDTVTDAVKEYRNEPGLPAPAITDGAAFPGGCRPLQ